MICKIADLMVDVPETHDLVSRCREYIQSDVFDADIIIREADYWQDRWPGLMYDQMAYLESAYQFYRSLLQYRGMMLHASAVEMNGRAYLFSGSCGVGKSTHTRLWQQTLGSAAQVFNDDKPALRWFDDRWFAYGTPWCGKDGINQNKKVPLAGICFLKQSERNVIRKMTTTDMVRNVLVQTTKRRQSKEHIGMLLTTVDQLVREIPIFELENRPEPEAALLSYETMSRAADEAGL